MRGWTDRCLNRHVAALDGLDQQVDRLMLNAWLWQIMNRLMPARRAVDHGLLGAEVAGDGFHLQVVGNNHAVKAKSITKYSAAGSAGSWWRASPDRWRQKRYATSSPSPRRPRSRL